MPLQLKTLINQHLPNGSVYVVYGMSEISNAVSLDYPIMERTRLGDLLVDVALKSLMKMEIDVVQMRMEK